jgi:hypothetical protein
MIPEPDNPLIEPLPGGNSADAAGRTECRHPSHGQKGARPRRGGGSSPRRPPRLGALEYALLALVALSVTVMIILVIVDPAG